MKTKSIYFKFLSVIDKKLWPIFSVFIRLRDSDENGYCRCITCGAVRYYRQMDCGHGVGRQHMGTKYSEKNNHAQCKPCNGFHGGKREKYKEAIDKKYGPGTWDLLEVLARQPAKYGAFEIGLLGRHYQEEIKKLKAKKNLRDE